MRLGICVGERVGDAVPGQGGRGDVGQGHCEELRVQAIHRHVHYFTYHIKSLCGHANSTTYLSLLVHCPRLACRNAHRSHHWRHSGGHHLLLEGGGLCPGAPLPRLADRPAARAHDGRRGGPRQRAPCGVRGRAAGARFNGKEMFVLERTENFPQCFTEM